MPLAANRATKPSSGAAVGLDAGFSSGKFAERVVPAMYMLRAGVDGDGVHLVDVVAAEVGGEAEAAAGGRDA